MPRYLRVADVPAVLSELQKQGNSSQPYQLDNWQRKWCFFTSEPLQGAAVLSYRWRTRGQHECIQGFRAWLNDCRAEGYSVRDMQGPVPVDWSLADGHALQIEVAAWLLWLHTQGEAEYAWLDQMCVPQDADVEEKIRNIRDSPAIYAAGKVFLLLAPVVDGSGWIMTAQAASAIVDQYNEEMNMYDRFERIWRQPLPGQPSPCVGSAQFLHKSAIKSLLVNNSYMRRVWTIQEAVAARDLRIWPFAGSGAVNSYQSLRVVDWPEFNGWNNQPQWEAVYQRANDPAVRGYLDGDYAGVLSILRQRPPGSMGHLALVSKDLMWTTHDRSGLVEALRTAGSPAQRAHVVLNSHQVINARSSVPEDRVLALVPLVDYPGWQQVAEGVHSSRLVQVSVAWAYDILERGNAQEWNWSLRIYNSPTCQARALELMQPRRNLMDRTAVHGTTRGWRLQIPLKGGTFRLTAPPPSPSAGPRVTADPSTVTVASMQLEVLVSVLMPHPGNAKSWSDEGGRWAPVRDALRAHPGDDGFRLSVQ